MNATAKPSHDEPSRAEDSDAEDLAARVDRLMADSVGAIESARRTLPRAVAQAGVALADALARGGKVLICGNGGSASDSLHFSSELLNKFDRARRPLAAVSLVADVAALTSIANDEEYDAVFAKQVEALARRGDVLVVITSSGDSPSILRAARAAQACGIRCIALNGKGGGALSPLLRDHDGDSGDDIDLVAPADSTARVQEIHAILIHALCELIDHQLFGEL
ncbi:MAG: D-sedoheptulose-7-phosphate isomerase [bacterium]